MIKTLFELKDDDVRPMTTDESKYFIMLVLAENKGGSAPFNADELYKLGEEQKWPFGIMVLTSRLRAANNDKLTYTSDVIMLCGLFMKSPSDAIMWAYALAQKAIKTGETVNIASFTDSLPWGVPTDDAKHRLWDEQKRYRGAADNWLDTAEPYQPASASRELAG